MKLTWVIGRPNEEGTEQVVYDSSSKQVFASEDLMPTLMRYAEGEMVFVWYFGVVAEGTLEDPVAAWGVINDALNELAYDDQIINIVARPYPVYQIDKPSTVII